MSLGTLARRLIYKTFGFRTYLVILSRIFFLNYQMGWLRNNPLYRFNYFSKEVIHKGDVIIDIGANLGYFTRLFAKWVGDEGKVYAVEPVQVMGEVLKKNISGFRNVEVLPYALGTEKKKIELLNVTEQHMGYLASGSNFIPEQKTDQEKEGTVFEAQMKRGSDLFNNLSRLDFIKCDIEGYETVVLPEMKSVIEKHRPIVLVESRREKRKQIIDFFTALGYLGIEYSGDQLVRTTLTSTSDESDIMFFYGANKERLKNIVPSLNLS